MQQKILRLIQHLNLPRWLKTGQHRSGKLYLLPLDDCEEEAANQPDQVLQSLSMLVL